MKFPGASLLRFSSDLATGSAGVLSALHSAFHPEVGIFPFLPNGQKATAIRSGAGRR
jgi:hypothetical protein